MTYFFPQFPIPRRFWLLGILPKKKDCMSLLQSFQPFQDSEGISTPSEKIKLRPMAAGSEDRAIFTVILPGKSLQQFEVSFNICSTDDWWSSTSSPEINAGALAGSSWEKNVGSRVCAFTDFLIPASNKKHEQGEIHIRLLLTVFHALCISSTSVSNQ